MEGPLFDRLVQKFRNLQENGVKSVKMPNFRKKRWLYPHGVVAAYSQFISATLEYWYAPYEEEMARIIGNYFPKFRADSVENEWSLVSAKLLNAQKQLFDEGTRGNFLGAIIKFGDDTSQFNETQFQKFVEVALGEKLILTETYLQPLLKEWAATNYDLIKTMSDRYISKTNEIVKTAVAEGKIYSEVMADLRKAGVVTTKNHAKLVARDQIGKLNSTLTRQRQQEVGIDGYIWDTSADERVRGNPGGRYPKAVPSHYVMEGKRCSWEDPTVYQDSSGKWVPRPLNAPMVVPGIEIQCRCSAIPDMDEIWTEAANQAQIEATGTTIPPDAQALNILEATPRIPGSPGMGAISAIVKGFSGAGILGMIPFQVDKRVFQEFGQIKHWYPSQMESMAPAFSIPLARRYLNNGIPEEPVKAVSLDGKQYLMDDPRGIAKVVALKAQGESRIPMLTVNLNKTMEKKKVTLKNPADT